MRLLLFILIVGSGLWPWFDGGEALAGERPADPERVLFSADFETVDADAGTKSGTLGGLLAHPRVERVRDGGMDKSAGIGVGYVGFRRGSERVVSHLPLARPVTEATLCYDVFFEEDFQFVRGGKLHGLGPDDPAMGGERVTPETWSARVMFGAEEGTGKEGTASVRGYNYHQNMRGKYGEGSTKNAVFPKGRWLRLSYHVRLNDPPARKNGFAHLYVDGALLLKHDGVQFRDSDKPGSEITRFLFNTFHGGSDKSWAPRVLGADGKRQKDFTTVHARFDNLLVVSGRFIRTVRSQAAP